MIPKGNIPTQLELLTLNGTSRARSFVTAAHDGRPLQGADHELPDVAVENSGRLVTGSQRVDGGGDRYSHFVAAAKLGSSRNSLLRHRSGATVVRRNVTTGSRSASILGQRPRKHVLPHRFGRFHA